MADGSKVIAYAMVGITVVVIIVGAITLKTMLAEPPACVNLKHLDAGDRVVLNLQRYLENHGTRETGSCSSIFEALDRTVGHQKASEIGDCMANAKTADAASGCIFAQ